MGASPTSLSYEERLAKVCREMKGLYGTPESRVKAVLDDLLKLYDNTWSIIEENNYEVLFEHTSKDFKHEEREEKEEHSQKSNRREGASIKNAKSDEMEPESNNENAASKRSSTSAESPESNKILILQEHAQEYPNKRARILQMNSRVSPTPTIKEKRSTNAEAVSSGRIPVIDVERNDVVSFHEPFQPKYKQPLAKMPPAGLDKKNNQKPRPLHMDAKASDDLDTSKFDIVSSNNGESKLSLIYNSSIKYDNLRQSFDSILELVEKKLCTKYEIMTNPEFSIKKLMEDFCDCYLELSTKSKENVPRVSNLENCEGICTLNRVDDFSDEECYARNIPIETENKMAHEEVNDRQVSNSSSEKDDLNKCPQFIEDITKGEESQPISLVNANGALEMSKFTYIARNLVYNNAYINFSLARISDANCCSNCLGNCLLEPANCACTSETRGEFAYTSSGLLEERFLDACVDMSRTTPMKSHYYFCENCPLANIAVKNGTQQKRKRTKMSCKGHLMRKFIKECFVKCGCSRNCGNRVVQRGITVKLQVFPAPQGKGWGVRTLEALEKGTFVCEYVGEIVTNMELDERNMERVGKRHTYPVLLDADWAAERHLKDEEALCLDATKFGNVARFINHRCHDANLIEIPVEVETPDHHYYHLAFFSTRKIEANEELTWDYGIDFDDDTHPVKAFDCRCGSDFCSMKNRY